MTKQNISKLTLGTVQLGQVYGVSNKTGKPDHTEALKIIKYGVTQGIQTIDTAPSYGNSEQIVGEFIKEQINSMMKIPTIMTKFSPIDRREDEPYEQVYKRVENQAMTSLNHLGISSLDIYLLHVKFDSNYFDEKVVTSLLELKRKGIIKKIGVSIYNPLQVKKVLELGCFDTVQVPVNVLDQRLIHSGLLEQLSKANIEVYARSIFLQGLFFLKVKELPPYLESKRELLEKFHNLSLESGIEPSKFSMLFVRDTPGIDKIIVGCETLEQLKQNIELINMPRLPDAVIAEVKKMFKDVPELVINPALWNT